jgi:hypothetical protein
MTTFRTLPIALLAVMGALMAVMPAAVSGRSALTAARVARQLKWKSCDGSVGADCHMPGVVPGGSGQMDAGIKDGKKGSKMDTETKDDKRGKMDREKKDGKHGEMDKETKDGKHGKVNK